MRTLFRLMFPLLVVFFWSQNGLATPTINAKAPQFKTMDSNGKKVALEDFSGKTVILEWTNNECPFVKKHYQSGNMQALQEQYTDDDVVWLTVISSAKGKQGHVSGDQANALTTKHKAKPTHVLLDESGDVGKMYAAKTTPHMYVIDEEGMLRYMGAIDSIRSTNPDDIPKATNYVTQAMTELAANQDVSEPVTRAYGCSVKY